MFLKEKTGVAFSTWVGGVCGYIFCKVQNLEKGDAMCTSSVMEKKIDLI